MLSGTGIALSQFAIAGGFSNPDDPVLWLAIAGQCLFMASFSLGYGPVAWIVATEVIPLRLRGFVGGIATFFNRLTSGLIALTFLSLEVGSQQSP